MIFSEAWQVSVDFVVLHSTEHSKTADFLSSSTLFDVMSKSILSRYIVIEFDSGKKALT